MKFYNVLFFFILAFSLNAQDFQVSTTKSIDILLEKSVETILKLKKNGYLSDDAEIRIVLSEVDSKNFKNFSKYYFKRFYAKMVREGIDGGDYFVCDTDQEKNVHSKLKYYYQCAKKLNNKLEHLTEDDDLFDLKHERLLTLFHESEFIDLYYPRTISYSQNNLFEASNCAIFEITELELLEYYNNTPTFVNLQFNFYEDSENNLFKIIVSFSSNNNQLLSEYSFSQQLSIQNIALKLKD